MKRVLICCTSRNHLRFLIPLIEELTRRAYVLLYCNVSEIKQDSYHYKLVEMVQSNQNLRVTDLSDQQSFADFYRHTNSLLVTTGSDSQWHQKEFYLTENAKCKTFAIQHGMSQDGITRHPARHFSADHVLTWVKPGQITESAALDKDKFISVGVPNHYYEKVKKFEGSKVFLFTSFFDLSNEQDIKLETSKGEWSGIYTKKWKEETWNKIDELCDNDDICFFVRHPCCEKKPLHPTFQKILERPNKVVLDTRYFQEHGVSRSMVYSLGSKYYVTYPSSCWLDCYLNGVDYEVFVDYNSNVDILLEDSLQGINKTAEICELLLQ